jgi:hypothetical protein
MKTIGTCNSSIGLCATRAPSFVFDWSARYVVVYRWVSPRWQNDILWQMDQRRGEHFRNTLWYPWMPTIQRRERCTSASCFWTWSDCICSRMNDTIENHDYCSDLNSNWLSIARLPLLNDRNNWTCRSLENKSDCSLKIVSLHFSRWSLLERHSGSFAPSLLFIFHRGHWYLWPIIVNRIDLVMFNMSRKGKWLSIDLLLRLHNRVQWQERRT